MKIAFASSNASPGCFTDYRDPDLLEHPLIDLLKQRIFGLCLGYEDLLDHDTLRHDALLAVLVGKDDPLHGHQLGRFFHGYYDAYCYLPLYVFCSDHPLLALLRRA